MSQIASFLSAISMILSLAGIVSIRMFTPVFLYMLLIRYGGQVEFLASGVARLQSLTPAWMNNDLLFVLFGFLAVLEIIANWNDSLREFLAGSDFEKYSKVLLSVLVSFGFLSLQDGQGVQEMQVLPEATEAAILPFTLLGALTCGALTTFFVKLRSIIVHSVRLLDPGNDLHLQTMMAFAEESLAVFLLMLVILLPLLALVLTLLVIVFGKLIQTVFVKMEQSTNHPCPACGKSISSLAENCPECGEKQEQIAAIGLFGLPRRSFIDHDDAGQLREHRLKMLMLHRCPQCATPLYHASCEKCHAPLWKEDALRKEMLHRLDRRVLIIALFGLLLNGVPIIGFPCFLIAFNILALSPLRAFLNPLRGCLGKFLFTFLKVLFMLIIVLVGSIIPFAGLLVYIPYGIYYLHNRNAFLRETNAAKG